MSKIVLYKPLFQDIYLYMSKTIILKENQARMLKEMAYPVSFDMNVFKSLPSFAARIRYCQEKLKRISSGSSRIVYKIDDKKVLKLAKNKKGIAQNEAEAGDYYKNSIGCFAEIYDVDENYLWIEMQLARRVRLSDFKRLTGYDFDVMCQWIYNCRSRYSRGGYGYDKSYDSIFNSEEFEEGLENYSIFADIQEYLCNYTLESIGDLTRLSSWGVVKDENGEEKLVIIDSGLSDDVWQNYYCRG